MTDASASDKDGTAKRTPKWPWFLAAVVIAVFIIVVLWIVFVPKADITTDDAYITAHYSVVAPRVSGQIVSVNVDDNQQVQAGQVLATLDPRDYQTAVDRAQAQLARDQSQVANQSALIERQPSEIDQYSAKAEEIRARIVLAQQDARRYADLASTGAGPKQQYQQAQSTLRAEQAQLEAAVAAMASSRHQLDVLKAQRAAADASVKADEAALAQARLNLSYTNIVAPVDGMVGERSAQVGNYVGPGTALMVVVPLDEAYVQANYRELTLRHILPGQPVTIHVDAFDIDLQGVVASVPPATGAQFQAVPPTNATGNFTKIVQRLPIKITFNPDQPLLRLIRLGLSVETTVHTDLANATDQANMTPHRAALP